MGKHLNKFQQYNRFKKLPSWPAVTSLKVYGNGIAAAKKTIFNELEQQSNDSSSPKLLSLHILEQARTHSGHFIVQLRSYEEIRRLCNCLWRKEQVYAEYHYYKVPYTYTTHMISFLRAAL